MIKWKVSPAPTGRYRSFERRSWPSADYTIGGKPAAYIACEDDYRPANVREGKHAELAVMIAQWDERTFKWRRLQQRFATLELAKSAAERFLRAHPEFWPHELRSPAS